MNLHLRGKKALITGGSKGIGLAITKAFLQEGAQACAVSRGSVALFENVKKLQDDFGLENIFACKCDCSNLKALYSLRAEIETRWNSLDVLIVNVGDGRSVKGILPDDEQWQKTWINNFESSLQTARAFLPMLEQSHGVMLFISSIAGIEAFGAPTDYSTAKTAIISLAKNMARKAAPNVRINVIAPGNVYVEGGEWDNKIKEDKERVEAIIKASVPMNRFATPEEIADAALFLCSERASFITGSTLVVDGGQTTRVF